MFTYPGQANLMERRQGYEGVFESYPDIKIIQAVDIHGEAAVAYQTAKDLLTSKTQVNAFVCLEAVACPEVGEAVKDTNTTGKVTIMAMDTDQRTLNWIQQGLVAATIAQKPYTMAYFGVKVWIPTSSQAAFARDEFQTGFFFPVSSRHFHWDIPSG